VPGWGAIAVTHQPIGNIEGFAAAFEQFFALRNAHSLSAKPAQMIPAYTQHLDVGLLPCLMNDYARFLYPLKPQTNTERRDTQWSGLRCVRYSSTS
jgi:hypothetical protein